MMSNLQEAKRLFQAGDRLAAGRIFYRITQAEPENQHAWLWLSSCVDDPAQQKELLQWVIAIDPNSVDAENARKRLAAINQPSAAYNTSFSNESASQAKLPQKKKVFWQWIAIGTVGSLIVCCALLFLGLLIDTNDTRDTSNDIAQVNRTQEPSEIESDRLLSQPTEVPSPIPTEVPSPIPTEVSSPVPTEVPSPVPTIALPEPIGISGTGATVSEGIPAPYPLLRIAASHDGSRNFILRAYTQENQELLVNTIGMYSGETLLMVEDEDLIYFEVDADGNWTLSVEPIPMSQEPIIQTSGRGDTVTDLFSPPTRAPIPYTFIHDGDSNFVVYLICASGLSLIQNEIGPVSNETMVRFGRDLCLWQIIADGNWSLAPK